METNTPSAFKSALKYGLILAVVSILYSLLLYSFSLMNNRALSLVNVLILIGIIIWGIKDYRDNKAGGFVSFGKAFTIGIYIGLIAAVISTLYTFVFFKYFDPDMIATMMTDAEEKMLESNPNLDEDQIETAMAWTKKFMSPLWMALSGLVMTMIMTVIVSLIVSAVMKKEDNPMQNPM
ncbi:MAG: DUF4199 domain-containing protein [Bacteroidales bacterium]